MRLFVNTRHPLFETIAKNGGKRDLWLGVPADNDQPEVGDSLGRNPGEIFFNDTDLLNTRRKIQLIFDSYVSPKMFIDGAIDPVRASRIIQDISVQLQAARNTPNIDSTEGRIINAGAIGTFGAAGGLAVGSVFAGAKAGAAAGSSILPGIGTAIGAIAGIVAGLVLSKHQQAGAEDDLAPWLFTQADFPHLPGQLLYNNEFRRSIRRVFDDRVRRTRNFPNNRAMAIITTMTLADALYGTTQYHPFTRYSGGDYGTPAETPLKQFFGFTEKADVTETYAYAVIYIAQYLYLIDQILKFDDEGLSRAIDLTEATLQSSPITISLQTFKVRLYGALQEAAEQVVAEKVFTYLDPAREYKTLLNAGNDRQYVMEAWRKSPSNPDSMQFKLLNPVDSSIKINDRVYISREIAKSVIDIIDFEDGPEVDITPYLRPLNTDVGIYAQTKQLRDVTLKNLDLLSGSQGYTSSNAITYEDTIFRRWYTADFNSSELNIDFTQYGNFVQFGSAYTRLSSFFNKLQKIEQLTTQIKGNTVLDSKYAQEKETIIRNFDPYEQYLFYATGSTYSASAFYVDNNVEYNPTGSWPKQSNGTPHATTSSIATNWYVTQSAIAQRYDEYNQNYLTKHLPNHILEDEQSYEFLNFVAMFGHVMDNLKEYIDQFPNIYSTNLDPYKELTMDQVYEVATSFGLDLPNVYSLTSLQQYFSSIYGEEGSRSLVAETWKRFLHAMMFIYKSKGTKTSLETVLSTYGIRTPMLQIKETSYASPDNFITSEELTYGLKFTNIASSSIRIPFVSSSVTTETMTVRFVPTVKQSSSLLTGDDKWAVNLIPHPSASKDKYGRIEIISGSNKVLIASSSYFKLYDTDYTLLALRSQSADFMVVQTDGDQILFQELASVNLSSLWNSTQFLYIGKGPTSSSINAVAPRSSWTAGALNTSTAFFSRSIDGNAGTRWDTNQFQSAGLVYDVNFNQQLTLVSFTMDTTGTPNDYPGTFSISSSLDGTTWTPINVISGSTITSYSFASPTLASQLRLSIVNPRTGNYWSIHEFNVSASVFTSSIKLGGNFEGIVDEVRTWAEPISTTNIINQAYDPGMLYGSNYSSSYANLYVNLSFSQTSSSVTQSLDNEAILYGSTLIPNVLTSGFTTASYTRLSRNIKQFLPVIGATVYSNNKIKVAPAPVFNSSFVDESTSTITLDPRNSIKALSNKIYSSGLNLVSFGVSPTDFINQDIIRKIGTVNVNESLGNNRDLKDGKYNQLDSIFKYYLQNYRQSINVNEFIDFYDNLAQAPAEVASWLKPARAKLLIGIVIESPILSRTKLLLSRGISVGGSNTKILDSFVSGSDVDFGVYTGDTELNIPAQTLITGSYTTYEGETEVTLALPTSSNQYYESNALDTEPVGTASAGYARHVFIDELEDDPTQPLYNIPPRSDLLDYGVTTYFHKKNSIYEFITTTPYKQYYLAKLEISPTTAIDPLYSKITLLPTSSIPSLPGRYESNTKFMELHAGETTVGLLNTANVFSLIGVTGASGSRVRVYNTLEQRDDASEASRSYGVTPSTSAGVLFDGILNGVSDVNPPLLVQTDNSTIYYRIDNTNSTSIFTQIVFSYFAYQPLDSIPRGYLPRHYRFSRDNTTALKRRNYLGCKATINDKVADPLGRTGFERPFYTTKADYNSIDVFDKRRVGGPPPRLPRQPTGPTQPIAPNRGGEPTSTLPRPTPTTGPSGTSRLTSLLRGIFRRNDG